MYNKYFAWPILCSLIFTTKGHIKQPVLHCQYYGWLWPGDSLSPGIRSDPAKPCDNWWWACNIRHHMGDHSPEADYPYDGCYCQEMLNTTIDSRYLAPVESQNSRARVKWFSRYLARKHEGPNTRLAGSQSHILTSAPLKPKQYAER